MLRLLLVSVAFVLLLVSPFNEAQSSTCEGLFIPVSTLRTTDLGFNALMRIDPTALAGMRRDIEEGRAREPQVSAPALAPAQSFFRLAVRPLDIEAELRAKLLMGNSKGATLSLGRQIVDIAPHILTTVAEIISVTRQKNDAGSIANLNTERILQHHIFKDPLARLSFYDAAANPEAGELIQHQQRELAAAGVFLGEGTSGMSNKAGWIWLYAAGYKALHHQGVITSEILLQSLRTLLTSKEISSPDEATRDRWLKLADTVVQRRYVRRLRADAGLAIREAFGAAPVSRLTLLSEIQSFMDSGRGVPPGTEALYQGFTESMKQRGYSLAALRASVQTLISAEVSTTHSPTREQPYAQFFSGGTDYASAIELSAKILKEYPNSRYNKYVFTFGDGETSTQDAADYAAGPSNLKPDLK